MERYVDLKDISDGKLYTENDMVKADAGGCRGCSYCCEQMADTILLDPLDIFRMMKGLACSFEALLQQGVELQVHDGLILPDLGSGKENGRCSFLNKEGRCSIHAFRPGFCRLFPLGRFYEKGDFSYFLQTRECPAPGKTKVKVKKWIDTPDLPENRRFINAWHDLQKEMIERLKGETSEVLQKNLNLAFLKTFYLTPYDLQAEFYPQFFARLARFKSIL